MEREREKVTHYKSQETYLITAVQSLERTAARLIGLSLCRVSVEQTNGERRLNEMSTQVTPQHQWHTTSSSHSRDYSGTVERERE